MRRGFCLTYPNFQNGLVPTYLWRCTSTSRHSSQTTTLCSASSTSLDVRRTRLSTVGDRAFPVAAARLWNSLPSHVTADPLLSPSSSVVLNHISSHFLIQLSDFSIICTVPVQRLVTLDTIIFMYRRASIHKKHLSGVLVFGGFCPWLIYLALPALQFRQQASTDSLIWLTIYCIASVLQVTQARRRSPTEHPFVWSVR